MDPTIVDPEVSSTGENQATFTIGEIAHEFGLTSRALRFYEDGGLVSPRRDGSARLYRQSDRTRLALVLTGKKLGFTLQEIRQLLAAQPDGWGAHSFQLSRETCVDQIRLLERRKRGIEAALTELRRSYSEPYLSVFTETEVRDAEQRNRPSGFPSMFPS